MFSILFELNPFDCLNLQMLIVSNLFIELFLSECSTNLPRASIASLTIICLDANKIGKPIQTDKVLIIQITVKCYKFVESLITNERIFTALMIFDGICNSNIIVINAVLIGVQSFRISRFQWENSL